MSCYLSRQGTRRSTAEWLTPNHCQEGWDFKLAGWMDEMACPHAAPLAEIYGHPLWSVVNSWFSFSCKNPDGKQKWKLHGLILTWSLVFCDMLQAVHLSAVHPGHSLTHGGKIAWPECKHFRNPLRCQSGMCFVFNTLPRWSTGTFRVECLTPAP